MTFLLYGNWEGKKQIKRTSHESPGKGGSFISQSKEQGQRPGGPHGFVNNLHGLEVLYKLKRLGRGKGRAWWATTSRSSVLEWPVTLTRGGTGASLRQQWWPTPVVTALRRLRQGRSVETRNSGQSGQHGKILSQNINKRCKWYKTNKETIPIQTAQSGIH